MRLPSQREENTMVIDPATCPSEPPPEFVMDFSSPQKPHDSYGFAQLASSYNFTKTSSRSRIMAEMIAEFLENRQGAKNVLDIGCGSGFGQEPRYAWYLQEKIDDYWGLEPDPGIEIDPRLFNRVERSLLEDADLPENHFDVAYANLVMEHVEQPRKFMEAVHRCLKPGGVFFFLTPNSRHYFTQVAKLMRTLKLDERVLRLVRGNAMVEEYHYPVVYQFNSPGQVRRVIDGLGFEDPQFVYLEEFGPAPYLPGPLRPLFWLRYYKRKIIKNPRCLLDLVGRIEKRS